LSIGVTENLFSISSLGLHLTRR